MAAAPCREPLRTFTPTTTHMPSQSYKATWPSAQPACDPTLEHSKVSSTVQSPDARTALRRLLGTRRERSKMGKAYRTMRARSPHASHPNENPQTLADAPTVHISNQILHEASCPPRDQPRFAQGIVRAKGPTEICTRHRARLRGSQILHEAPCAPRAQTSFHEASPARQGTSRIVHKATKQISHKASSAPWGNRISKGATNRVLHEASLRTPRGQSSSH